MRRSDLASWLSSCILATFSVLLVSVGGLGLAQQAPAPMPEPEAIGGPATLRRLTESQYRASIAEVFGADISLPGRFERGLRVDRLIAVGTSQSGLSPFSFEQYDGMARAVAAQVVSPEHRLALVPCRPRSDIEFDTDCARQFVSHYGLRLFRRPLTRAEVSHYVDLARRAQQRLGNFHDGLKMSLAGLMVAPDFLFRVERTVADSSGRGRLRLDPFSKATRLSFFLINSTPDAELLRAAETGELDNEAGLARQVDRLMASPRFEQGVRAFFWDMLVFDAFDDLSKDPVIYPAFNSYVSRDAQEQTMRTIVDLLVTRDGDYRDIFTTRRTFLTRALGQIYQMPVAARNGFEATEYPADSERSGILTDISFLALHSHPGRSSPTIRGKSIREVFLCQRIPPPPANVDFTVVQDASNRTMPTARMRLEAHRTQPACSSCHRLMDPLGLGLENFDGLGASRMTENGARIDASGELDGRGFSSPAGLGRALHDSPLATRCLVSNMYRYAVGRNAVQAEQPWLTYLNQRFAGGNYRVPALMRAIATSRTFYAVAPAATAAPAIAGSQ